jgi:4'-phosphopantetheinyl transferase EntD
MAPEVLTLFPSGVVGAALTDFRLARPLWATERRAVEGAVPKRVLEFTAGRHVARRALERLGVPPCAIPRREDRAPAWPHGTTGDISHCPGYCGAVVGHARQFRGLGFDVECDSAVTFSLLELIARPEEAARLEADEDPRRATVLFSAKEAFYKAQHAITRQWVGFTDVEFALLDERRFELVATADTPGAVLDLLPAQGEYRIAAGHVFAALAFRT